MLVGLLNKPAMHYCNAGTNIAQTVVRAATLRQKLQIKPPVSPRHSILTPDQPVSPSDDSVTPGAWLGATGVLTFKSLV